MTPIHTDGNETHHAERTSEVPVVRLPIREARLRRGLVALSREAQAHGGRKRVPARRWRTRLGAASALLAVAGAVTAALLVTQVPGPAVAFATFEVNPAFTIAVDARDRVVELSALDAKAAQLLSDVEVTGKDFDDALRAVADVFAASGYLDASRTMSVAVRPAPDVDDGDAQRVADLIEGALGTSTDRARVVVVTLSARDFSYLDDHGLLPGDYAALVADGATIEAVRAMVAARGVPGPEGAPAEESFGALIEVANDMVEVGIPQADALALLGKGIGAGLTLDELSEFTDVHEALIEDGLSVSQARAWIERRIDEGWDAEAAYEYVDRPEGHAEDERDELGDEDDPYRDVQENEDSESDYREYEGR